MRIRCQLDARAATLYDAIAQEYFPVTRVPSGWGPLTSAWRAREGDSKFCAFMYQIVCSTDHDVDRATHVRNWSTRLAITASDDPSLVALAWQEIGLVERFRATLDNTAANDRRSTAPRRRLLLVSTLALLLGILGALAIVLLEVSTPFYVLRLLCLAVLDVIGLISVATTPHYYWP